MKNNKVKIRFVVISIILLISFVLIIISNSGILFKLKSDISNIVNSSDLNISFKTEGNSIIIESDSNNLKYQLVESNFDTVNRVRLLIKDRDSFIKGYDTYIAKYSNSDMINKFNNGKEKTIKETNEEINKVISDLSISNNWNDIENNTININQDSKDRLVFVRDNDKNYVYYSIKSKELLNIDTCQISEAYLKYSLLTDKEKKEKNYIPPKCEKTVKETDDRGTVDGATYPSKYPENFGTDDYFNTTLTKIKNQGQTPNCVMFATIASLEDYLMKKYNQPYYFSERYASYKMSVPFVDDTGLIDQINSIGARTDLEEGFYSWTAARFLGYYGPIFEDEMPYVYSTSKIPISKIEGKTPRADVNKVLMGINMPSLDVLKEYISTYGGVAASTCWDSTFAKDGNYYNDVCDNDNINHKITIIGWDDNYPKENFTIAANYPERDGAFIVKNSYGNHPKLLNGYMYVSYDQFMDDYISVQDADFTISDNQYYYDKGGIEESVDSSIVYQAIKIERKNSNEKLTKIRFSSEGSNNAEIYIINDPNMDLKISNATLIGQMSAINGINTFELENPIDLSSSAYIIIKSGNLVALKSYGNSAIPGNKMFYSTDGNSFSDIRFEGITIPIAAYTDNVENVDFTKPIAVIAGGENPKENSQTLLLQCNDKVGIAGYYFGTFNPSPDLMTNTTDLDKINNGGISTTINDSGIYYLGCMDTSGNYQITSAEIKELTMTSMTQKNGASKTPYNTHNYDEYMTKTYLVRKGVTLRVIMLRDHPGAVNYNYVGYSLGSDNTVEEDTEKDIIINEDTSVYSWFTINPLNIMVRCGPHGKVKIETVNQEDNSIVILANETSGIDMLPGDSLKITAMPDEGYTLDSLVLNNNEMIMSSSPSYILNYTKPGLSTIVASFVSNSSTSTKTVTFKNGTETYGDIQTVKTGSSVSQPPSPTKEGYTFRHWSTSENGPAYDFNTAVTSDMTLYAVFTDSSIYTVTFNPNEGTVSETTRQINSGSTIGTLPVPTRNEYTFEGWYIDLSDTSPIDENLVVTSDITLIAKWTKIPDVEIIDSNNATKNENTFILTIPTGIKLTKTKVGEILSIPSNFTLKDKSNNEITAINQGVGTNSKIVSDDKTYDIVIRGDINGDGELSIIDLINIYSYMNEIDKGTTTKLNQNQIIACDFKNDNMVDILDLINVYNRMKSND